MAAEVEDAVGRQVDFLIRADVEAMKNIEAWMMAPDFICSL